MKVWQTRAVPRVQLEHRLLHRDSATEKSLPNIHSVVVSVPKAWRSKSESTGTGQWIDATGCTHALVTAPLGGQRHHTEEQVGTLGLLQGIMNHALACGHIRTNPARGIKRNRRPRKTRFLSRDEIRRLHESLDRCVKERASRRQQVDIIRLLLFTGCRRGEIVNLQWTEVRGDVLDLADAKTGPRRVYLSGQAQEIIGRQPRSGSDYVFPSPRDPTRPLSRELSFWYRVRKVAGLEDVRLHDLRHSHASQAVLQGVPLPVVSKLLGHRQLSMTVRYAHVADQEVEAAAERIGNAIAKAADMSVS